MNRRRLLKQLAVIAGGMIVLPSCAGGEINKAQVLEGLAMKVVPVNHGEDIAEFILRMIEDCYSKNNQDRFFRGLQTFSASDIDPASVNNAREKEDDVSYFYNTTKSLVIQHYTNSQYYLTEVQPYELAPGRYHGCVPRSQSK